HNRAKKDNESPLTQRPQVLTGLTGIGKTQIAVEYAYRFCHEYHSVILLDADPLQQPDKITFAKVVAEALGFSKQVINDPNALIAEVQEWLSSEILTRWLLIFDNVES